MKVSVCSAITVLFIVITLPVFSMDCEEWEKSLAGYEKELKLAIDDEPEDVTFEMEKYLKAKRNGYSEQMERIASKSRMKLENIVKIDPPVELAGFHNHLIDCHRYAVDVIDAEESGDKEDSLEAQISTWESTRDFFLELKVLLLEYNCNTGDVEALEKNYLPEIEKNIEKLKRDLKILH